MSRSTPLKRNLVLEICKVFWVERFFLWVFVPDRCSTRVLMEDFLHCRAWGEAKLLASVDPSRWLLQHGKAGLRVFWLLLHGCLELWSSQDTARGEVVSWIDKFSCEELMILNTLIHAGYDTVTVFMILS
ncbi:hypothetical protein EJB05_27345, partial [Eragrostis curvula]